MLLVELNFHMKINNIIIENRNFHNQICFKHYLQQVQIDIFLNKQFQPNDYIHITRMHCILNKIVSYVIILVAGLALAATSVNYSNVKTSTMP